MLTSCSHSVHLDLTVHLSTDQGNMPFASFIVLPVVMYPVALPRAGLPYAYVVYKVSGLQMTHCPVFVASL